MAKDWVELEDHTDAIGTLKEKLHIDPERTAIVTIDMHRGHLDPVHATMPVPLEESRRVRGYAADLLAFSRDRGIPVVHVILTKRPVEAARGSPRHTAGVVLSNDAPATEALQQGIPHNIQGSVQTELMPEMGPEASDLIIDNKKTFSAFVGTDLDNLLRVLGTETAVLIGINTNTCVQCSAFDAANLGYKAVVVSDCVASMYGQDLHVLGLQNISRCIGWVLTVEEFKHKVLQHLEEGSPSSEA